MSRVSLLGNCNCSSAQLVASWLSERRSVIVLHLLATVDAVIVGVQVFTHWEPRQVDLRDFELVLVPTFHALLAVFVFHCVQKSSMASMTEWFKIHVTVCPFYPQTCESEIGTYMLQRQLCIVFRGRKILRTLARAVKGKLIATTWSAMTPSAWLATWLVGTVISC